jgi:thioesterase domain-containing protein
MLRHLDADQPVYGVQPFGLDGQQEPYTHIEDMTAHYIREIRGLQPHGPYQLVGDTLGGLFAFDIAQQLMTEGEEVALLAMFDTSWPLPLSFGPRMASHLYHLKELGVGKYLLAGADSVRRKLLSKFGNREEVMLTDEAHENADRIMNSGDPLQRTEWAIYLASIVNYQPPKRRYPGRITYFMAQDNVYKAWFLDNRLHWKKAARELEVHSIPGRHDTLREEPYVVVLAEKLKECLYKGADSPQRTQRNTEEAKLA